MRFFSALLLCLPIAAAADKWNVSFQYDVLDSTLNLRAMEFITEQRAVAVGVMQNSKKNEVKPVALVTADGGKRWDTIELKEEPLSLSCISDDICWISTPKGVWRSEEGGRRWTRISKQKGLLQVFFTSANEGWAGGIEKSAYSTSNGGVTWTAIEAAKAINANPENASFTTVSMAGRVGLIAGNSRVPRKDRTVYPDWMVPEQAASRREWPGMLMLLETRDAGKTWHEATSSVFGSITGIRVRQEGVAVALLEYFNSFKYPSEILWIDFRTGKTTSIHHDENLAISDVAIGPGRRVMAAGTAVNGLRGLPIPAKVQFIEATLSDSNLAAWSKIDVDYRAVARRVHLATSPAGKNWAVTDTGFILRLDRNAVR